MAVSKQFKYANLTALAGVLTALVLVSSNANSQTMTVSTNWLTAASGTEPIEITLDNLAPSMYQVFSEGAISVRWNGRFLPTQITSSDSLQVTVPPALRVPGLTEFVLWDTKAHQPLPFRAWISVIIPTVAEVFEADPASDRVVAAVGGDGTAGGTGGAVSIYSLSTGALRGTVPVPASQRVLAFTPDTQYAWLAVEEKQGKVARLNLATGQVDQQIQFSGYGGTPYNLGLSAQVFEQDPRILMLSDNSNGTNAYLNGSLLPNAAPQYSRPPFPTDDRGRLLMTGGQACELAAEVGFTNCAIVLPGFDTAWMAVWKDKACDGPNVYDVTAGDLLLSLIHADYASYLAQSNRIVFTGSAAFFGDGDSLEVYTDVEMPLGSEGPRRVWAPDWMLIRTQVTLPSYEPLYGILVGHVPQLLPAPAVPAQGIVNSATGLPGPIAPGEIVSIFGQNLGPVSGAGPVLDDGLLFATDVEDSQVLFEGVPAAILYTGAGQINVVVPETVAEKESPAIQVLHYGIPSPRIPSTVAPYSPGIFTYAAQGKPYAAAMNADGVIQGPATPLRRGTAAVFYVTGVGLPPGETAESIAARPAELANLPTISIGGLQAQVTYAGTSPGLTSGLTQINVVVPGNAPTGNAVEVVLTIGSQSEGNVWVAVQ